jgi:CHAD domain-containing protein
MNACAHGISFREYAFAQTTNLLETASTALSAAAKSPDAGAVHKMRVSIRRLQQALRLFSQFLNKRGAGRVRKQLKEVMAAAGELRNFDIAIPLVRRLGTPLPELKEQRITAKQNLAEVLGRIVQPDLRVRWTAELGIDSDEEETVEA